MNEKKLSLKEMICYGFGDITANFYLNFIGIFLLMFFTDVLGIPAATAGIIYMLSRIFDGINDIAIGYLSDKTGHLRRWMLLGAIVTAAGFVLLFTRFDLSPQKQVIYALVTFCLWTLLYTTYAIPYNTFASTMTQSTEERTKLNSIRFTIVAVPLFVISLATPYLQSQAGGSSYTKMAFLFAVIATVAVIICVAGTTDRVKAPTKQERTTAKEYFKAVLSNKQLLLLSVAFFLFNLFYQIYSASMAYYFNYYIGSTKLMSTVLFINSIIYGVAAFLVNPIANRIGKKPMMMWCTAAFIAASVVRYLIPSSVPVIIATNVVNMFAQSSAIVLFFVMIADTTDYGKWLTGKNVRAVNYGFYTFCQKVGMAFSATIVGGLLDVFGYVANQQQTETALQGILLIYCIVPAVIALIMLVIMKWWKLSEDRMHKIVAELNERERKAVED